jgi:hypothetical protein
MSQTTYQVILSTDGKHTVIFTSDSQDDMKVGVGWARASYQNLVDAYGLKYGPKPTQSQETEEVEAAPICAVHNVPMEWVDRNGGFWSCHQRVGEGWCKFRPKRVAA